MKKLIPILAVAAVIGIVAWMFYLQGTKAKSASLVVEVPAVNTEVVK